MQKGSKLDAQDLLNRYYTYSQRQNDKSLFNVKSTLRVCFASKTQHIYQLQKLGRLEWSKNKANKYKNVNQLIAIEINKIFFT